MLFLFRLMVLAASALPFVASAATVDLLVGSYTTGEQPGLYAFRFDTDSGKLDAKPWQQLRLDNPSWLVLSADQQRVYVVNENGPGARDAVGRATALVLDAQHRLTVQNQVATLGDEPTFASLSPDGCYLLVANYSVHTDPGGSLAVLPIASDGSLRPVTQLSTYQASHVDKVRQQSSHIHAVNFAPNGKFAYVADLGGDRVYAYRYLPAGHAEHPLQPAATAFLSLPPGSGPRHLVFDKAGKHAYLTLEMAGQVAVLDVGADGALTLRHVVNLFAPGFSGNQGAGAIHLSADGRFLYAVNRGTDNHIAVFAVGSDGALSLLQRRSAEGRQAREFSIDPSGKFLLVAVQGEDHIAVIARDPATGRLGKTLQTVPLRAPSDIKFLRP
ncbi:lactonase family protein [Dyella sp.]|jgi:6-phosphogluconolactonase (cycloisomerase 2 family)|uniref:lactonase family protein n=1 Tax=Dyella sp. TaxID=1869338 RepID=UPI002D78339E|nr:lactonase family protein [Dyella sp.]HET6431257.1 lactonase family protein [Dyella sp.]